MWYFIVIIYPRVIKDFWSIARFDYTILGIIATFSASANESSPFSLRTEIPNKNTAFNSPESHPTVSLPPVFLVFRQILSLFFRQKNWEFFLFAIKFVFCCCFLNKRIEKIGKCFTFKKK